MSNYYGCKREAKNLIPHYIKDLKTVKPSHLEILQIIQNVNNHVPYCLHIFWLNIDKENDSFLLPFLLLAKADSQKTLPGPLSGERRHE